MQRRNGETRRKT